MVVVVVMLLPLSLQRPLVFGDSAHIEAIRNIEKDQEYKDAYDLVKDCMNCLGDGYKCSACGSTCPDCEGTGKDHEAWMKFRADFPECRICR